MQLAAFGILSLLAILGAFGVVFGKNPLYCALSLVGVFLMTAALYGTLHSPFLAMLQIMVYAGAIMVLFIFVIMLLNLSSREESGEGLDGPPQGGKRILAVVLGSLLVGQLVMLAFVLIRGRDMAEISDGSPRAIGESLFQNYLVPFEMVGILLLVAIVGIVALTRRHGRGLEGAIGDELLEEEN